MVLNVTSLPVSGKWRWTEVSGKVMAGKESFMPGLPEMATWRGTKPTSMSTPITME